jgi:peptidyl-tRNA hydrolase
MYFGRVLVIGCGLEAALAHVSTILCRLRLRQKKLGEGLRRVAACLGRWRFSKLCIGLKNSNRTDSFLAQELIMLNPPIPVM